MRKKLVILERKDTKDMVVYYSTVELFKRNSDAILGFTNIGTLWNALSKNKGHYENKKCKIYYKMLNQS